jgi:hypothetical protein
MLLVSERAGICPVVRHAAPWDRIAVRLRAFSLDGRLARGEPPEAMVRLALRAQQLVSMRMRRRMTW